jgi:hypothetical protein
LAGSGFGLDAAVVCFGGPVEIALQSAFFELGGSSLAAAKLTSALRERFPAVAVADIYNHRRLGELSARLDQLGRGEQTTTTANVTSGRRWGAILNAATKLGDDSLVGVLSVAPRVSANGTSWFGSPPLEFPRVPERTDPSRTTNPECGDHAWPAGAPGARCGRSVASHGR